MWISIGFRWLCVELGQVDGGLVIAQSGGGVLCVPEEILGKGRGDGHMIEMVRASMTGIRRCVCKGGKGGVRLWARVMLSLVTGPRDHAKDAGGMRVGIVGCAIAS